MTARPDGLGLQGLTAVWYGKGDLTDQKGRANEDTKVLSAIVVADVGRADGTAVEGRPRRQVLDPGDRCLKSLCPVKKVMSPARSS